MRAYATFKTLALAIAAVLLVLAAVKGLQTQRFLASAVQAEGTVIDVLPVRASQSNTTSYSPVFEFRTADGREVEVRSRLTSNPPAYREGDKVAVLYAADEPGEARIAGFFSLWGGSVILVGLGTVFLGVWTVMVVLPKRAAERARELAATGTPLKAEIREVELNRSLAVNGRHPWRIVAQWKNPVTAELHEFRSTNLWDDPSPHLHSKFITVFVDGQDVRKYHMDTTVLPKVRR